MRKLIIFTLPLLLLASCSVKRGYVQSILPDLDERVDPEFREYLKSQDNLSVVLRVPASSHSVTQEETLNDNNTHYALIERNLMSSGFNVRDRGLLNLLLESGITDYSEIARKTNANVIIEIISMNFPVTNHNKVTIEEKKNAESFLNYWKQNIEITNARIEFKLVQIENGKIGAMSTCYFNNGDYFYYRSNNPARVGWNSDDVNYAKLALNLNKTNTINAFSEYLVSILRGEQ
jgi:hypothetical protein